MCLRRRLRVLRLMMVAAEAQFDARHCAEV
jgi:hypothetical protein